MIIGKLLHQADDALKRAACFAPTLAQWPQPRHVKVSVADGSNVHAERRTSLRNARAQSRVRRSDAGIKSTVEGFARVKQLERLVQCIEQVSLGWLIGEPMAPIRVWLDDCPTAVVHVGADVVHKHGGIS
jgi:hypothetical protein